MYARLLLFVLAASSVAAAQSAEDVRFFEEEVRPLLVANCSACHGDQLRSGGLALVSRQALLEGGNRGPSVVPGDPDHSTLILAVRQSGDLKMPPGGQLEPAEIAVLERWVSDGAAWGAPAAQSRMAEKPTEAAGHWSFEPIRKPAVPAAEHPEQARNAIDRFVQAKLAEQGLAPSPPADRTTLIRRLSLDLTGLPPSPVEIEEFVESSAPDAYERLVDRLLASPHYGERWGRHWLDIAHYADSNGYNQDHPRQIWLYRDWVIDALNRDLPFDRFVVEQIAGDLLANPTEDQLVATGFHRNTLINLEGGIDFEQYRTEAVVDRVDTVGAAFLGLTLGCARCHSHKYDPITQKEFYQFFAFYDSIDELSGADGEEGRKDAFKPTLEFGSDSELSKRDIIRKQLGLLGAELREYEEEMLERQVAWEASLTAEQISAYSPEVQEVLRVTEVGKRNQFQVNAVRKIYRGQDLGWTQRSESIAAVRKLLPELRWTMVMRELAESRSTHVHLGGDFLRLGVEVQPGTPRALPALHARGERADRLDLARWLVSDENPLTARVTVNRVWQRFFGLGIVETENDFGSQGRPPSHPELLDWLASGFRDQGWSLKKLHRLIVTSATYRQSSQWREDVGATDPRNRLLSRQSRLRLEAEIIRDSALSASGLLYPAIGGPSVYPPQPAGASKLGQMQRDWVPDEDEDRYRRGMYTFFWRASPHPGLMIFDAPDSTVACTRRERSNTPLQALTLLNDEGYYELAQAMAKRVLEEGGGGNPERLGFAFRLALGRMPDAGERERLGRFLRARLDDFHTQPAESVGATPELAAWTAVSRVLLNLDEFVTRE